MAKLTEKQERFANEYIRTGNITQAYLSSYDNVKSDQTASSAGSRLLRNVNVEAYITKRLDDLKKESIAEQDEVLQFYTSVLRAELTEEVVISSPLGVEKVNKLPDIRDRQRAGEEILKRHVLAKNQTLKDELLEMQIKKIAKEIETGSRTEDKMQEYFSMLDGVIGDE